MVDTLEAILRFERFLFGGVPESAAGVYERDGEARAAFRLTGEARGTSASALGRELDGPVVCIRRFDPELRQMVFEPLPSVTEAEKPADRDSTRS